LEWVLCWKLHTATNIHINTREFYNISSVIHLYYYLFIYENFLQLVSCTNLILFYSSTSRPKVFPSSSSWLLIAPRELALGCFVVCICVCTLGYGVFVCRKLKIFLFVLFFSLSTFLRTEFMCLERICLGVNMIKLLFTQDTDNFNCWSCNKGRGIKMKYLALDVVLSLFTQDPQKSISYSPSFLLPH